MFCELEHSIMKTIYFVLLRNTNYLSHLPILFLECRFCLKKSRFQCHYHCCARSSRTICLLPFWLSIKEFPYIITLSLESLFWKQICPFIEFLKTKAIINLYNVFHVFCVVSKSCSLTPTNFPDTS